MWNTTANWPCKNLDDAPKLWNQRMCLEPVSKNLRGELHLLKNERQECETPPCVTLKTDHALKLEIFSHDPCDSEVGQRLDGVFVVRELVHAFNEPTAESRGIHTGAFTWSTGSIEIVGEMSGMTNVGTHREPVFDPCQECHDPGYMEGRLCGRIVKAEDKRLVGCLVTAVYRLRFDHSVEFQDTAVQGTLEGAVVCPCEGKGKCIDFTSFDESKNPNPWMLDGCEFFVADASGAPAGNAEITSIGGTVNGLNAGHELRIQLASPASAVSITLINFSTPSQVLAFSTGGVLVGAATMTVSGTPETLTLAGADIATVVVRSPQNETLVLEFCVEA